MKVILYMPLCSRYYNENEKSGYRDFAFTSLNIKIKKKNATKTRQYSKQIIVLRNITTNTSIKNAKHINIKQQQTPVLKRMINK